MASLPPKKRATVPEAKPVSHIAELDYDVQSNILWAFIYLDDGDFQKRINNIATVRLVQKNLANAFAKPLYWVTFYHQITPLGTEKQLTAHEASFMTAVVCMGSAMFPMIKGGACLDAIKLIKKVLAAKTHAERLEVLAVANNVPWGETEKRIFEANADTDSSE